VFLKDETKGSESIAKFQFLTSSWKEKAFGISKSHDFVEQTRILKDLFEYLKSEL
jgi:hypothetical protein